MQDGQAILFLDVAVVVVWVVMVVVMRVVVMVMFMVVIMVAWLLMMLHPNGPDAIQTNFVQETLQAV